MLGIVLDRLSIHDVAARKPLHGDMGRILSQTLAAHGVSVERDCIVSYAIPNPDVQGERYDLIKGERQRVMEDMRQASKVLCVGALATAACVPLPRIPSMPNLHGLGMMTQWPDTPQEEQKYLVPTYSLQKLWQEPDLFRCFVRDIVKWLEGSAPLPAPHLETHIVQSEDELRSWIVKLLRYPAIGADIETGGLDFMKHELLCLGFAATTGERSGVAVVVPYHLLQPKQPNVAHLLATFLGPKSPYKGQVVWHNGQFDIKFLYRYTGEWLWHRNYQDTLLMDYACDERPIGRVRTHGLKDISRYRLDVADYKFDFDAFWARPAEERDWSKLYEYQALDCWCTARLYDILRLEMEKEPQLGGLYQGILIPGTKALAEIEAHGILVDVPYLKDMEKRLQTRIDEKKAELAAKSAEWGYPNINPASPAQLAVLLYDILGLTAPSRSVDKDTLKKARKSKHCTEEIRTFIDDVLEFRNLGKLQGTYVKNLLNLVASDGRFHGNFNIAGTATGRLSSSGGLNLQNLPVHGTKEFKRAFIAPQGYTLVNIDYQTLELRIAAWCSGEPVWKDAFVHGIDVHRQVASLIFGKELSQVSHHERFLAKSIDFGCLFGRSAKAIAEGRENDYMEEQTGERLSLEAVEQFHNEFKANLPTLYAWIDAHVAECWKTKKVISPFGRVRRFPLILPFMRGDIERRMTNSLIQGCASDVAFSALIRLHNKLPEGAHVLATIHDSILFCIRDDLMNTVMPMILAEMQAAPLEDRGVPFTVSAEVGKDWGYMEEWHG